MRKILRRAGNFALLWLALTVTVTPLQRAEALPPGQERITIRYGDIMTGVLDDTRFFQQYSFEGRVGDRVVISMDALSGNLDPLLLLGDADLNLIAEDDDGGEGFNARLEVTLPADGAYIIEATRYGQDSARGQSSGGYRLTLLVNQAAGRGVSRGAHIDAIGFGKTVRGTLTPEGGFRFYWFQAEAGDRVHIQSALSLDMSAFLVLYDSSFRELKRDATGRQLDADLPQSGIYFAALSLHPGSVGGTYGLVLSGWTSESGVVSNPGLPLLYGEQTQGTINDEQPLEHYMFQGQANDQVLIEMGVVEGDLDPFLYLYGPDGEVVGQDDDSGSGSNAALAVVLPADGRYSLVASRFGRERGETRGSYLLGLSVGNEEALPVSLAGANNMLPPEFEGIPTIRYGDVMRGPITDEVYYRAYIFEASAGDQIVATMENAGGDLDPMLMLLDSRLQTVAENDDIVSGTNRNARLEYTIPSAGYYALLATRYAGETGTTTGDFVLTFVSPNAQARSRIATLLSAPFLIPGGKVTGQISDAIAAVYTFYAAAGDRIDLDLTTNGPLRNESLLILADADLIELAASPDGALRYNIREDGLYVVVVTREGGPAGTARGFFDLRLDGADPRAADRLGARTEPAYGPGSVLPYGTVVTDVITDAQFRVEYHFTGAIGDRITVRMTALDATLDPALRLLDPQGNELANDDDSGGDLNAMLTSYLLMQDGQYTLVATRSGGRNGTSRGRFELTLAGVPVAQPPPEQMENSAGAALPLAVGQTTTGVITSEQAAGFYVFEGRAGQSLDIDMVRLSGNLDCYLALLDAGQSLLEINDDGGGGQNARLLVTLPADGQYTIVATRYLFAEGTTTGEYLLSLLER